MTDHHDPQTNDQMAMTVSDGEGWYACAVLTETAAQSPTAHETWYLTISYMGEQPTSGHFVLGSRVSAFMKCWELMSLEKGRREILERFSALQGDT